MLECQRDEFSLPRDVHYFNCAYMGPLPRRAQVAGAAGIARKAVPIDITPRDFFADAAEARRLFATLIGSADPQRVAILPAVSYGVATAARNLPCAAGQHIVTAADQFPGNDYGWRRLAAERGAQMRTVAAPDSSERGAAWNEALLAAIDGSTAIVALPHVHWTDGTRFDLELIAARAREHGAALVIDGTQSIGALPFDLPRIRPDAVLCAAYKWLLGPYSLAYAWYGERFDGGVPIEETWIARAGSEDFQRLVDYRDDYQPGAIRYDVGERSNFTLLPMSIAALRLVLSWQPPRVQEYCAALTQPLLDELTVLGYGVEDARWRGAHLFGLRMPAGVDPASLQRALQARGVYTSLRGNALRLSPHVYNDPEDVAVLKAVLTGGETTARALA